ncbi:von Willebrand factor A domain-containing protein 7-like isoform X2 [Xyrauchen texanus]|nr:von Willebrand factor A domain-containing protein 7-like isoform X2 [Xyrauchen texanus]XP_051994132.1 von Willebrand factor A domain-containing protein 7-like isoform X2 [Xyrauchen texanus]XP_051994133.1 von Willebrand factor A domain-containing protein 7-like isoform X2 [Xyrauchen texanus]
MDSLAAVAVFLLLGTLFQPPQAAAFKPLHSDGSLTHREITQIAILRKTAEACRDIAVDQGREFTLPINNKLTVASVRAACSNSYAALSTLSFTLAVALIYRSNAAVDYVYLLTDSPHVDNEAFIEARDIITRGLAAVKASMKQENYNSARVRLGALFHTLQDFYSHSNWVELGFTIPLRNMTRSDLPLNNLAGPKTPTCKSCNGDDCSDNILPEILQQKILTTGYFNLFSFSKPTGKCSHGGIFDMTSRREPTGGINKDTISSQHGFLHNRAANLAINATMEVLEDIRLATNNTAFLRLMGLSQTSVMAFVIDTTASMSDDIAEAKRVSFSIIDSRKGTSEEPSEYILVAFNDPGFGPLIRTENADIFKEKMNSLTASGGGDAPEMCLSGLLLALAGAPPSSNIFVFTDAAAKDSELKSTIEALIESTKSTVNFMLTHSTSFRKRRSVSERQSSSSRAMSQSEIQLYRDLAHASGGQAIEVTKVTLPQATKIIPDTSTSALVTVFQVVRNPAKAENFSFVLDESLSNVTVYVTGDSPVFTLYSPTGVSQSVSEGNGALGSTQNAGNWWRLQISVNQTGQWRISINATSFYTLKVFGQSSVDFLFNFVEYDGNRGDFIPKDSRPLTGGNATLFLSLTGGATVTEVLLVNASGSGAVNGTITAVAGTEYLVTFDRIPEGAFLVQLNGLLIASSMSTRFQRQSPTQQRSSRIIIMSQTQSLIEPGVPFSFNFTVNSTTTAGNYTIRARTNRGFKLSFSGSLSLGIFGSAQGSVTVTAPSNTEFGTDVTLTIEAQAPGGTDFNFVTQSFIVSAASVETSRWYSVSFSMCLSLMALFVSCLYD